ncbi:MAG: 4Fe-4S binding protein, partial [Acidobacteriota bacterium]|nr:4Fe-4S binding protein [Acidobacteriota bacterium]
RFYFVGIELWISEFSIIFFTMMLLMFVVAASAIVYGRIYCGYACPQMIFSEWSVLVEKGAAEFVRKRAPKWSISRRKFAARAIFYAILALASVFLAFVFTSYFVEPRDLVSRLAHFDLVTTGGITGASVTLLTFLDFTLVRQGFCKTVCPYGYLQGMLQDQHTLMVVYQDETNACIECKKCVNVCEMGIDIRDSPYQIECVHCGDCVDACEDVLRRLGHPGLIHYAWGEKGAASPARKEPWHHRLGFRDAKRVVLLLVLLFYSSGLAVALSMRRPVLAYIAADRSVLYEVKPDGRVANRLRVKLANRSSRPVQVALWAEGIPNAELALVPNPVPLAPGQLFETTVELRAPRWPGAQDVNPFRILAQPTDSKSPDVSELTFILPDKRN